MLASDELARNIMFDAAADHKWRNACAHLLLLAFLRHPSRFLSLLELTALDQTHAFKTLPLRGAAWQ